MALHIPRNCFPYMQNIFSDNRSHDWILYREPYNSAYTCGFVFGDSRTWNFQLQDWEHYPLSQVMVCARRGAEVQDMSHKILSVLSGYEGDYVSIKMCLGINNILNGESPGIIFDRLLALKSVIRSRYNFSLITFAEVAHVSLEQSTRMQFFSTKQANDRIDSLNQLILECNKVTFPPFVRGGANCFLSRAITKVRCKRKRNGTSYRVEKMQTSLLYDGIHAINECKVKWVNSIIASSKVDYRTFAIHARQES